MVDKYTKLFKALGEPTRIAIVRQLAKKEMCVCELMEILKMNQPRISQHLKVLKEAGILSERKQAQWSYYSLCWDTFKISMEVFYGFIQEDVTDPLPGEESIDES